MPRKARLGLSNLAAPLGAFEAAIALCGIPVDDRRAVDLEAFLAAPRQGQGKRAAAGPAAVSGRAAALARKKDHGRAEASLIALYGARS